MSIAVSVCIFITMSAFINNLFDFSSDYYADYDYNIVTYCTEENLQEILQLNNIDEYFMGYFTKDHQNFRIYDKSKINVDEEYNTKENLDEIRLSINGNIWT